MNEMRAHFDQELGGGHVDVRVYPEFEDNDFVFDLSVRRGDETVNIEKIDIAEMTTFIKRVQSLIEIMKTE